MKSNTKNFRFYGDFNIGPYNYNVANLPMAGTYLEVIRSKEIKYPSVGISFNLYSHKTAQGLGHFIKRLIWDILAESDKYKEFKRLDISSAYAIEVDDDLRHVNFKFANMQYMPDKEYKRDNILKEMIERKKMTFKDVSEWCLSRIKRCVDYKITQEFLDIKKKEFKDYNDIEKRTVNITHPLISVTANDGVPLSNCALNAEIDKLTVDDVNDILNNVFSFHNLDSINFELPANVTLYEVDEFVATLIVDILNQSTKTSHYAQEIAKVEPKYEDVVEIKRLAEKLLYFTGEEDKIAIDDNLKITRLPFNYYGKENPSKHILVRTCPVIIDGYYLYDTNKFNGMYAYLGSIIAGIVFNNYIYAKQIDNAINIHSNDRTSDSVVNVSERGIAITRNNLLNIKNDTDIDKILSGFKEYAREHYEHSLDFYLKSLKEELLLLFTGGVSYKYPAFFRHNDLMMLWNLNRTMRAEKRAEDIDLVFGNREEYLFSPFVNSLFSEDSVKIIKRFTILAINNLEFIEISNNM